MDILPDVQVLPLPTITPSPVATREAAISGAMERLKTPSGVSGRSHLTLNSASAALWSDVLMISLRQTPTASCRAGSRPVAKSLSLGSQQIRDGSCYGVVDEETQK